MATHDLAHGLSVSGLLHTHATRTFQAVKAHDTRELGPDQFLISVHRQHRNFQRLAVSASHTITPAEQH